MLSALTFSSYAARFPTLARESPLSESEIEVDINKARLRERRSDPAVAVWDEWGGRLRSELQFLGSVSNMSLKSLASSRHIVTGMANALHAD